MTLTSDLSRKNLEKDFERMDTPQGTFYRKQHQQSFPFPPNISSSSPQHFSPAPFINPPVPHEAVLTTTPPGVYFDILLALDGSEFNAELVCQGEVMGRCTARFR